MEYHQVEVDPRDREKTAFLTQKGLVVYNFMPFGLCNAPTTFQRLIEHVLCLLIGKGVLVYFDDLLIYSATPEQLIEIYKQVLKLLEKAGLKCNAPKCSLFTQCVHYLKGVVSKKCIYNDPTKLEKIKQYPKPEKRTGICNYYRGVIYSFAHLSDSLDKVSRSDFIDWTSEFKIHFDKLKKTVVSSNRKTSG